MDQYTDAGNNQAPVKKNNTVLIIIGVIAAVFIAGILVIAVLAALLFPALARAKSKANETVCINNLRQISMALFMYSDDHNGNLPPDFKSIGDYLPASSVFACPANKDAFDPSNLQRDYVYLAGHKMHETNPDTVLVYDRNPNHRESMNVLFADGRAENGPIEKFQLQIQQSTKY